MSLEREYANAIFARDGWKCRFCRSRNNLHPHHVTFKSHGGGDEPSNLLTLCAECHRAVHDGHLEITVIRRKQLDLVVSFKRSGGWRPQ